MLFINTEFRKGIFFIRLEGNLTKDTINEFKLEVTNLIKDNEITNVLINLSDLEKIDRKGISELYYVYELSKSNRGLSLICGINDNIKRVIKISRLTKYFNKVEDELFALKLV